MGFKTVFKRYELKYMITKEQKEEILKALSPYMTIDEYGRTTIRNIYFDTDDYILARHSIAKPDFKEKLRIRSYSKADDDSTVFVELKRKYDGVVYKRRVALTEHEAKDWVHGLKTPDIHHKEPQKTKEIDYFFNMYDGLHPALYLSYEREAYKMRDGGDFRVTFDENIMARDYDISLESDAYGTNLIEDDKVLMELKCSGGLPLWMVDILSVLKVYKRSFSKYGTAYQTMIYPNLEIEAAPGYAAAVRAEASRRSERTADTGDKKRARAYTAGKRRFFRLGRQNATA